MQRVQQSPAAGIVPQTHPGCIALAWPGDWLAPTESLSPAGTCLACEGSKYAKRGKTYSVNCVH